MVRTYLWSRPAIRLPYGAMVMRRITCKMVPIVSSIAASRLSTGVVREVRRQLGIPRGTLVLTYFGFVHERKGFDQVLDLIQILELRKVAAVILVLGELLGRDA